MVLVLGDQLSTDSSAFDGFDASCDIVAMAEVAGEASDVPSHKARLVLFFAAMRHFRDELAKRGDDVVYHELTEDGRRDSGRTLADVFAAVARQRKPEKLILTRPGDHRVLTQLKSKADELGVPFEVRPDRHFYCPLEMFKTWAKGRKSLTFEYFYRMMRKREAVLMGNDDKPVGGQWNYDHDNRESFGKAGSGKIRLPKSFEPDATTRQVIALVQKRFADHPGSLKHIDFPVTSAQAREALDDFIEYRLSTFGRYEDAMWIDQPVLYHSRLSAAMNLHLLDPRECVDRAVAAYEAGNAPLASVEGFVRQVLGWREFIRGVYWHHMPEYAELNALGCDDIDVPTCYWTGETDMACLSQCVGQVIERGYAHHIQRLMVMGLFAQLLGVHPYRFHQWHMAMYLDAIDWASLPNTLGMSQFGDGGIVGTKPYCATGKYIKRMSNYCDNCRFNPDKAVGEDACPITTLYWDFLDRNRSQLAGNGRMTFQLRNLERKKSGDLDAIRPQARAVRDRFARP